MAQVDLERLVLPSLLALLVLGAFLILVTNGGGGEPARTPVPEAKSKPAASSSKRVTGSSASAPTHRFVKVQDGDTPTSIAGRAQISVDRLLELNPSVDPSSLRPGQTLKLAP